MKFELRNRSLQVFGDTWGLGIRLCATPDGKFKIRFRELRYFGFKKSYRFRTKDIGHSTTVKRKQVIIRCWIPFFFLFYARNLLDLVTVEL